MLREPWEVGGHLLAAAKIKYLFQLLAPVFFLPLLTAGTLIVLPSLLFNLLSTFSYQTDVRYHYTSLIIPVFAWAAIAYLGRVKDGRARDFGSRRALAVVILVASLASSYAWGPAGWSPEGTHLSDPTHPQARAFAEAVALIPKDAVVSARARTATHLTHRDKVYEFPTPFSVTYWGDDSMDGKRLAVADEVDYVIETPEQLSGAAAQTFALLKQEEGFKQMFSKEGVVLLQRMPPSLPTSN